MNHLSSSQVNNSPSNPELYRSLLRIRRFEETVLANFSKGVFYGTTHTYLGQEANAVGILGHIQAEDAVISNHRCHGHFLAYGGNMRALFAELMGKETGVCGGRGGSQHLHWNNFYSNGILGGTIPIATGIALAEKLKHNKAVAIVFMGDGSLGEGVVYESFNMASLWRAPILFVVENNQIAQSTPIELALAGQISARFESFGIQARCLDTSDVCEIYTESEQILNQVRNSNSPQALIVNTFRFGPHSKGDDTRDQAFLDCIRQNRDPLLIHGARVSPTIRKEVESQVEEEVRSAFNQAMADPEPKPEKQHIPIFRAEEGTKSNKREIQHQDSRTVLQSLNAALHTIFVEDERAHMIGEDLLDPYGGAFKITQGLSTKFPERVHTSPVSEAGIVGIATGMALRGLLPIVEIMFGDFITLATDQVINHLSKFHYMYNEQLDVPIVIRTPMGGRRGYGATHSQTLEKLFLGVPGLRILAPCIFGDPGELLIHAVLEDRHPVIFVENKLLYLEKIQHPEALADFELSETTENSYTPTYTLRIRQAPPPSLTIATYGYMSKLALDAARALAYEHEIFAELVIPTQLAPFEMTSLLRSLEGTRTLVVVEEGVRTSGWGAEIVALAKEKLGTQLNHVQRVAAQDTPIPASAALEVATLPDIEDIVNAARTTRYKLP